MKKLMKWFAILGVIFCLLGIGIMTAGAMIGGMDELNLYFNQSDLKMGAEHKVLQPWEAYVSVEERVAEPEVSVSGSEEFPAEPYDRYENIRSLSAEVGAGKVELREMEELEENEIAVERWGDGNPYLVEQEGNELEIEFPEYRDNPDGMETLIIGVPTGFRFQELDIEVKAGSFYADQVAADRLSLDVKAGEIQIMGGSTEYLEVEVKAGTIACLAEVEQAASVECSSGSANLLLAGEKNQYDYQLECAGGSIVLNGEEPEEFTRLYQKKKIDNHTGNMVDLECQMGTITVDFQMPVL